MKKITRIALLFCLLSPLHFTAQAADIPAEPSIFVIGEKATVPGSVNKLTRSFQVIVNNNDKKPIYCKKAIVTAGIGKSDCGTASYGKKQLSFGPFWMWGSDMNSPVKISRLGGDRLDEFATANPDLADGLEYCYRGETELNCGYQCDKEGKNYGDDWTVTDAGGSIHFECAKNGKPAVLDMTCNPGYDKFPTPPIGPSCGPSSCPGNHVHGSVWSEDTINGKGKIWYTCNYGRRDWMRTNCVDEYYEANGELCVPKPKRFVYNIGDLPGCNNRKPRLGPFSVCHENEWEAYGPYIDLPHRGHLEVNYFVTAQDYNFKSTGMPPPETTMYTFDITGSKGSIEEDKLLFKDLTRTATSSDLFDVAEIYQYTKGKPGPEGSRAFTIHKDISEAEKNVEFRVLVGKVRGGSSWYRTEVIYTPNP